MSGMTQEEKRFAKRKEIMDIAEKFRDERGNLDLSQLRQNKPKVYASISYYFGSIDQFMVDVNADKTSSVELSSVKPTAIRNQLAFERLNHLRVEKDLSFDVLGKQYDKSRMYMSKLYRDLEVNLKDADVGTTLSRPVVRNQLAFEMLDYLIKNKKMSFEDIAKKYDVPAEYVERLYNDWKKLFTVNNLVAAVV